MAMKKVLAAVGLVCVIGSVAVAAINAHSRISGSVVDPIGEPRRDAGEETIFGALQTIMHGKKESQSGDRVEAQSPDAAESDDARIAFRKVRRSTETLTPFTFELGRQMGFGGAEPLAYDLGAGSNGKGGSLISGSTAITADRPGSRRLAHSTVGSAARSSSAGGVDASTARRSSGAAGSVGSGGANGSKDNAGGTSHPGGIGPDGAIGTGPAFSVGGTEAGDGADIPEDLERITALSVVANEPPVMVMPLPSSFWMLLGAVIGLGVLGYSRRAM